MRITSPARASATAKAAHRSSASGGPSAAASSAKRSYCRAGSRRMLSIAWARRSGVAASCKQLGDDFAAQHQVGQRDEAMPDHAASVLDQNRIDDVERHRRDSGQHRFEHRGPGSDPCRVGRRRRPPPRLQRSRRLPNRGARPHRAMRFALAIVGGARTSPAAVAAARLQQAIRRRQYRQMVAQLAAAAAGQHRDRSAVGRRRRSRRTQTITVGQRMTEVAIGKPRLS